MVEIVDLEFGTHGFFKNWTPNKLRQIYAKWCIKTQILRYVSACSVGKKTYCTKLWKAHASAVNFGYLETILVHPTRRQTFAGKLQWILRNIWDLVIYALYYMYDALYTITLFQHSILAVPDTWRDLVRFEIRDFDSQIHCHRQMGMSHGPITNS